MNLIAAVAVACLFGAPQSLAQNGYISNQSDATVSVINTATNAVIATVPVVGANPTGVAVTPDGSKAYVTSDHTVPAINTVIATVPVPGSGVPMGVAVTPDGEKVYVANLSDNSVSVINTATNTVRDAIGHAGVGTRTVNIQNGLLAGTGTAPRSAIAPPR